MNISQAIVYALFRGSDVRDIIFAVEGIRYGMAMDIKRRRNGHT